jgi:hypothetical protein
MAAWLTQVRTRRLGHVPSDPDLLFRAKHLFVAAIGGAMGHGDLLAVAPIVSAALVGAVA